MNALTMQVIREGLGYTRESLAAKLEIRERTIRQAELGQREVPEFIANFLSEELSAFVDAVEAMADAELVEINGDRTSRAEAFAALQLNPDLELDTL